MSKTLSQLHLDWQAAKAKYAVFIKYYNIKLDLKFGETVDVAAKLRAKYEQTKDQKDWGKSHDAVAAARAIADKYTLRVKNYMNTAPKNSKGAPPAASGGDKGLLAALVDIQKGLGIEFETYEEYRKKNPLLFK